MAQASGQDQIGRVRPPRVHIVYKVQKGIVFEEKELPFVVGVLADLSGKPNEPLPSLVERKFVNIDRDNFDAVMRHMKPRLAFTVDNKLTNDNTKMAVELHFENMEDFEPDRVVNQVEPLRKLLEKRRQLSGLLVKMGGNNRLGEWLQRIVNETELLQRASKEAGLGTPGKDVTDTKEESHE